MSVTIFLVIKNYKLSQKSIVIFLILASIVAVFAISYTLSLSTKQTSIPSYAAKNNINQAIAPTPQPNYDLLVTVAEKTQTELLTNSNYAWSGWDWESGIALVGLMHAYEALASSNVEDHREKAAHILDTVEKWIDREISEGTPFNNDSKYNDPDCNLNDWSDYENRKFRHPNHVAPSWALLMLYDYRPKKGYYEILKNSADFLVSGACKLTDPNYQILAHTKDQVWDDTLAMSVPFLAKFGSKFDQPKYIEFAYNEFKKHSELLQVSNNGWGQPDGPWLHGCERIKNGNNWECDYRQGAYWTRGNAWAAISGIQLLDNLPESQTDKINSVKKILRAQLEKHYAGQSLATEKWRTVTNNEVLLNENNYHELSGSSGLAYSFLRLKEFGIMSTEGQDVLDGVGRLANFDICNKVAAKNDGTVPNVSTGTGFPPKEDTIERYLNIPYSDIKPYGQGLFLIMASLRGCL